jgi:hypothetical protein
MNKKKATLVKGLAVAFAAAAAVMLSPFGAGTANAARVDQFNGYWQKTECFYWNPVESTGRTCFTEARPGNIPGDWDTTAYTPFFNGRDVIYGPGAHQFNA